MADNQIPWFFQWLDQRRGEYVGFGIWVTVSLIAFALTALIVALPILLILWGAGIL